MAGNAPFRDACMNVRFVWQDETLPAPAVATTAVRAATAMSRQTMVRMGTSWRQ